MSQSQLDAAVASIRRVYSGWGPGVGIAQMREQWDALFAAPRLPAEVSRVDANGVPCAWIRAPQARTDRAVMFLHGGGYQVGSCASHHNLMAALSAATGCAVLGVEYRLAPEHRFPAPVDDALAAWNWLLAEGYAAPHVALCGDSAGGNLCIALMAVLRDRAMPLPAAAAVMSPWADLECSGKSLTDNAATDPVTSIEVLRLMARTYLGKGGNPREPLASTVHANLARLSPLLVQVGSGEVLVDDARTLVDRANEQGTPAVLTVAPGMVHVFQLFAGRLDEADAAITEAGHFLRARLDMDTHQGNRK
jgi:epsilon-lactone hydrolase